MEDRVAQLESRVATLYDRVGDLEQRLALLGGRAPSASPATSDRGTLPPIVDLERARLQQLPALAGRTLVVLGGAYLLRALTETHILPASAGVGLGILYGSPWLLLASRSAARGARPTRSRAPAPRSSATRWYGRQRSGSTSSRHRKARHRWAC